MVGHPARSPSLTTVDMLLLPGPLLLTNGSPTDFTDSVASPSGQSSTLELPFTGELGVNDALKLHVPFVGMVVVVAATPAEEETAVD